MCGKLQEFYEDLFQELSKYGEIESLNVCDNLADHMVSVHYSNVLNVFSDVPLLLVFWLPGQILMSLYFCSSLSFGQVGNVYVQFREEEHAANALKNLTGRFYAG